MLRNLIGDEAFFAGLRAYLESHAYGNGSTPEFRAAMEASSGRDLTAFFDEWVYGSEMPSYKLTYSLTPGEGGKTIMSAKLTQSGVSDNFVMLVPIYLDFGNGWAYLGSATIVGNKTLDINNIALPASPKKVTLAALQDVLAEKIEVAKQ